MKTAEQTRLEETRFLVQTNHERSRQGFEYELINTGVFNEDQYFDVFVEYAKESPEDILVQISTRDRIGLSS